MYMNQKEFYEKRATLFVRSLSHPIPSHVWVAADGDKCLQLVPMY